MKCTILPTTDCLEEPGNSAFGFNQEPEICLKTLSGKPGKVTEFGFEYLVDTVLTLKLLQLNSRS